MPVSDDSAALAAATLTAAIVNAGGISAPAANKEETIREAMDIYRRALNVVRKAAAPAAPRK